MPMPSSTKQREDEPEAEVLHFWTPFHVNVDENYDFLPKNPIFRLFSRFLRRVVLTIFPLYNRLFFHLRVNGMEKLRELEGGAVTICNHVHLLDCTMVADCFQRRMVYFPTLKSNMEIPVVGGLVRLLGGIPIPKENRAFTRFSKIVNSLLQRGEIVHLYPEGILAPYYHGIRSFRRGAFTYAYDAEVPVIPMVISYRQPGPVASLLHKRPLLNLDILDPVYPDLTLERHEGIDVLREGCWQAMNRCFEGHAECELEWEEEPAGV